MGYNNIYIYICVYIYLLGNSLTHIPPWHKHSDYPQQQQYQQVEFTGHRARVSQAIWPFRMLAVSEKPIENRCFSAEANHVGTLLGPCWETLGYHLGSFWVKKWYGLFRGDPDVGSGELRLRGLIQTYCEGIPKWSGTSTNCHFWVWIKAMDHIP